MPRRARRVSREPLSLFPNTLRWCTACERYLPPAAFQIGARTRDGLTSRCKDCLNAHERLLRQADPRRYELRQIGRLYGLTRRGYEAMLAAQDGKCLICARVLGRGNARAIDHDHKTGVVRGILCRGCNTALGQAREDPALLRKMADYLERHRLQATECVRA